MRKHLIDLKGDATENNRDFRFSKLWMALPSLMDAVGSIFSLLSLLLIPASLSIMLSGGNIIFTTIISRFMLGTKILNHHALGCCLSLIGFIIVGFSATLAPGDQNTSSEDAAASILKLVTGIIFNIISLIIVSIQGNTEELILNNKSIDVQRMIGLEGMFGFIWASVICIAAAFFPCPNDGMCDVRKVVKV